MLSSVHVCSNCYELPSQASKVSHRVKSRMRTGDNYMDREGGSADVHLYDHGFSDTALSDHREDANSSGASTPIGDVPVSPFAVSSGDVPVRSSRDSGDENEGKVSFQKIISSKAEQWISKKGLSWPWKGNEHEGPEARAGRLAWPWLQNDQEYEPTHQNVSGKKPERHTYENIRPVNNEALGSWSSSANVNSTSSASSCGSTSSSAMNKVDLDSDSLDCEILWEDLTIGEQIGQGNLFSSHGVVACGIMDCWNSNNLNN